MFRRISRPRSQGEKALDGMIRKGGGNSNAASAFGCNPVTVKVDCKSGGAVNVKVEVDVDLSERMAEMTITEPSQTEPSQNPKDEEGKEKLDPRRCSESVIDKSTGLPRQCKWSLSKMDAARKEGLCTFHYHMRHGKSSS